MIKGKSVTFHGGPSQTLSSSSIIDLPTVIFVNIFLRLPTKSIVTCKSVCKTWHSLISDPLFVKLHSTQSNTCLLIRDIQVQSFSRALYLFEPEEHVDENRDCQIINLKSKLKAPVRNPQAMLTHMETDDNAIFGHLYDKSEKQHLIRIVNYPHVYRIAISCNGVLCLADGGGENPPVVSNPVTGEFFHLPKSSNDLTNGMNFQVGFGFSPKSNKYKVVRTFTRRIKDPISASAWRLVDQMAEIHTLGIDHSWRNIDVSKIKKSFVDAASPAYVDGAIHWLFYDYIGDPGHSVVSFDLEDERFRFHPVPSPPPSQLQGGNRLSMGVVEGRLCVYNDVAHDRLDIWAMKPEMDVFECWTKLFSVDVSNYDQAVGVGGSDHRFQPLCCLKNGDLVLLDINHNKLVYCDKFGGLRVKHLMFCDLESSIFRVIAHTPTFVSLKDIVIMAGNNDSEVHNVNLRCGKIKFVEETYHLLLHGTNH